MMSRPRNRLPTYVLAALALALPAQAQAFAPPTVAAVASGVHTVADRPTVREAQRLLNGLGYDAGAPDGVAGPLSQAAARAFQSDNGLAPDGQIDAGLIQALKAAASPPLAARIVATPPPALPLLNALERRPAPAPRPENDLQGETWRFTDDGGATMVITFREDGRITGPAFADGFSWRQDQDALWLTYESPLGGRVARQGTVESAEAMSGDAQADRGPGQDPRTLNWTWRAERIR